MFFVSVGSESFQMLHFCVMEESPFSAGHTLRCKPGKSQAFELSNGVPLRLKHSSDKMIPSFVDTQDHFPPSRPWNDSCFGGPGRPVGKPDAFAERPQIIVCNGFVKAGPVDFLDFGAGMRQAMGKIAIICQQENAGRVTVQPADRIHALTEPHVVQNRRPSPLIVKCRDAVLWFVQKDIERPLSCRYRLAVDRNAVVQWIDLRSQFLDHSAIDSNGPRKDELVVLAAGSDTGQGQIPVQPKSFLMKVCIFSFQPAHADFRG
jgi:hypothetical protein